ncbi:MAG: outer membrane protein assembly factor BamA [bacterium]
MIKNILVFTLAFKIGFCSIVGKISFEGNKRVSNEEIKKILPIKEADEFFPYKEKDCIKAIYNLGEFEDIESKTKEENGSISITFFLKECPLIKKITFSGNKKKKTKQLKELLTIKEGKPLFIPKINEEKNKIISFYKKEGFYFVEVEPKIKEEELIFEIKENEETKIKKIRFSGNRAFSSFRLKWKIKTGKGDAYIKENIDEDIDRLCQFYKEQGYARVTIQEPKISFEKKGIIVDITVNEGKKYKIGKIEIEGNTLFSNDEIRGLIKVKEGEIYNLKRLEESFRDIVRLYYNKGYVSAGIIPEEFFKFKSGMVDYKIYIDEGEVSYIEGITIVGNKKTKDKVIRRELLIKEGDLFLWDNVSASRQRLSLLGYFEDVGIDILPGKEKNKKIVQIEVKEGKRGTALFGLSYTSQYGIFGSIQTSLINLFGMGYSANIKADIGKKMTNYELSFNDPWFFDKPISLGVGLWHQKLTRDYYAEDREGGYISLGKRWKRFNRIYLKYKLNRSRFVDVKDDAPSDVIKWKNEWGLQYAVTSSIETGIIHDTRMPNVFSPEKGSKISLSSQFAGGILGGDINFYKPNFEASWYIPSLWKFILCLHTDFGFVEGKQVSDSEKFYLGGAKTIRGYEERSIHPLSGGGDSYLLLNTEYKIPLGKSLSFGIFLDGGNTWEKGEEVLLDLKYGTGFGLSFNSPVGPLRFDYAWPLSEENKQPQFHFTIGEAF